jgi:SAM-dependent methyltransferase
MRTGGSVDDTTPMRLGYADDSNLRRRLSIYAYQSPRRDVVADGLAAVEWRGDETVVDVGCGNGMWLRRLPDGVRRIGLDQSGGMLDAARDSGAPLVLGDAEALPFADGVADVGLAMHMLYHVPAIADAVAELRRVVRPGGVVLATTNGEAHLSELIDLLTEAIGVDLPPRSLELRFTAETAREYLERSFSRVEATRFRGELLVPDADPVVGYIESLRAPVEPALPAGRAWADVVAEARRLVSSRLPFRAGTDSALFVCR